MNLGGWAIGFDCYLKICEILPEGSTILELGSGMGTDALSKRYKMYSVEHDLNWMNRYLSTYIYAPIKDGWYALEGSMLPERYDLILVDGPPSTISPSIRYGFMRNIDLFNTKVTMIFDDVNRVDEHRMVDIVAEHVNRDYIIFGDTKKFAVL